MAQAKRKTAKALNREEETVTCLHCRYERPAQGEQCPLCGYPWPWVKKGQEKK